MERKIDDYKIGKWYKANRGFKFIYLQQIEMFTVFYIEISLCDYSIHERTGSCSIEEFLNRNFVESNKKEIKSMIDSTVSSLKDKIDEITK